MLFKKKKLNEDEFSKKFAQQLLSKVPQLQIISITGLEIITKNDEGESKHFLNNAFAEYNLEPKSLIETIERYINAAALTYLENRSSISIDQIVPIIKDHRFISGLHELNTNVEANHVYEQYNEELYIFYAIDTQYNLHYLRQEEFKQFGISSEELRQQACINLNNILDLKRHGGNSVYMITAGGNFEASTILFDIWNKETFPVEGEIVIGIPARDMLVITGSNDTEGLSKIYNIVCETNNTGNHLISDKLFEYKNGKFEVFSM